MELCPRRNAKLISNTGGFPDLICAPLNIDLIPSLFCCPLIKRRGESNPRRLGGKRECLLCALPSPTGTFQTSQCPVAVWLNIWCSVLYWLKFGEAISLGISLVWPNRHWPQVFGYQPLKVFLILSNSRCNAKFLWKRTPLSFKSDKAELSCIWKVGQALWLRDNPTVFATIAMNTWSEELGPIMSAIGGNNFKYSISCNEDKEQLLQYYILRVSFRLSFFDTFYCDSG